MRGEWNAGAPPPGSAGAYDWLIDGQPFVPQLKLIPTTEGIGIIYSFFDLDRSGSPILNMECARLVAGDSRRRAYIKIPHPCFIQATTTLVTHSLTCSHSLL